MKVKYFLTIITALTLLLFYSSCGSYNEGLLEFEIEHDDKERVVYIYTVSTSGKYKIYYGQIVNHKTVSYEPTNRKVTGLKDVEEVIYYKKVMKKEIPMERLVGITKEGRYFTLRAKPGKSYRVRIYYPVYRKGNRWVEFRAKKNLKGEPAKPVFIKIDDLNISRVDKWAANKDLPEMYYDNGIRKKRKKVRRKGKTIFDE